MSIDAFMSFGNSKIVIINNATIIIKVFAGCRSISEFRIHLEFKEYRDQPMQDSEYTRCSSKCCFLYRFE